MRITTAPKQPSRKGTPQSSLERPRPVAQPSPAAPRNELPTPDQAFERAARYGHDFARLGASPAQDAPIQGKWILRGGQRVQVPDEYELQPGESTPEGLRRRVIHRPPEPEPPPPVVSQQPSPSLAQRLDQVGTASGNVGIASSVAEHLHSNPVSEAISNVPILGAVSSANTAVKKRQQSEQAYLRGNLGESARHELGSIASGIKSASDTATVLSGGLTAPVTVPVSTVASLVNTATSAPEYLESASDVVSNPRRTASRVTAAVATAPETVSSIASTVSNSARSAWNYLTGAPSPPPPSAEQQERQRQQEERERLESARARARSLRPAKWIEGKLD